MNGELLRSRLMSLIDKTQDADATTSWWDGDRAGKRQALDDLRSGRRFRQDANCAAKQAVGYLDDGEETMAEVAAWAAMDFYVSFLESWMARVKPRERPSLAPAKRRGAARGPRKK